MVLQKFIPRTRSSFAIVSIFTGVCALSECAAAEDYFDLSLEQLLEIQVSSVSKKNETVARSPAAIYVVTSEDIARSGVTSIPSALRMVPGVNVARLDSNSWAVSVRGFNNALSNKLLVLIDGRSIYNPVFGGVYWEAQHLMLADIERIEVIRGPGRSLWGANAVNGVINIITKHSNATQGRLVSVLAGSEESEIDVRHGGAFGDGGTYRGYTKAFKYANSQKPGGGASYDAWDGVRAGFRADWGDDFTLQGDAYRTNAQQRSIHYSLITPFESVNNQDIVYQGVSVLGRWTNKRADGAQLSIQTYIDWTRRDVPFNFMDNRTIYDIEAQYNFAPMDTHELIAGVGFMADNEIGNKNVSFSPNERRHALYNIFVQDKITLSPERWFLTLGSKFEYSEFSEAEIQPNVRLQWHPNARQTWWASASRAVRTPTPIEEDVTSTVHTAPGFRVAIIPNDELTSEQLKAYELGYRVQLTPSISTDVTAFYNDYDHLTTYRLLNFVSVTNGVDPPHVLLPVQFTNGMSGKCYGFEASFNWTVSENLKVALDYSYLRLTVTALTSEEEIAELLYPKQQLNLKAFWNISEQWTLDTTAAYVDKLPGGDVAAYARLDINLGGQLSKTLRLNVLGQNLLDKTHREFGSADDINAAKIERNIAVKLSWIF